MVITPAHVSIILKKENFWIELRVLGFLGWDSQWFCSRKLRPVPAEKGCPARNQAPQVCSTAMEATAAEPGPSNTASAGFANHAI